MFANRKCEKNTLDALLPDQQLSWQTSGVVYSEGHYMCPRCSCWQCGSGYDAKYSPGIKYNLRHEKTCLQGFLTRLDTNQQF